MVAIILSVLIAVVTQTIGILIACSISNKAAEDVTKQCFADFYSEMMRERMESSEPGSGPSNASDD